LEKVTTSVNVMPYLTACEIQGHVYSKQREAITKGEKTRSVWICCCVVLRWPRAA